MSGPQFGLKLSVISPGFWPHLTFSVLSSLPIWSFFSPLISLMIFLAYSYSLPFPLSLLLSL